VMYEIPSRPDIKRCLITADTIRSITGPELFNTDGEPIGWESQRAA
jgi:ATP-dependent protease Clp ATPase subunit